METGKEKRERQGEVGGEEKGKREGRRENGEGRREKRKERREGRVAAHTWAKLRCMPLYDGGGAVPVYIIVIQ